MVDTVPFHALSRCNSRWFPYSIHGNYVVELSPQEIAEKYEFCLAKGSDNQLHLKTSHPYYAQIQMEMAIINVEGATSLFSVVVRFRRPDLVQPRLLV